MENAIQPNTKSFFYPPGGLLIWIVVFLELLTFSAALIVMASFSRNEPAVFANSSAQLNKILGAANTFVLISSGFFMALSVAAMKKENKTKTLQFLRWAILGGLLFIIIKSVEYYLKIDAGLTMNYNLFFTFYWMLTLFHLAHVVVGLVILIMSYVNIIKGTLQLLDYEAGATFWHMCDLIWLLIFPVIYLFF